MTSNEQPPGEGLTRRRIFGLTAAACATSLFAACGADTTEPGSSGPSSKDAAGGSDEPSGTESGKAGAALTKTADVPVGSGVILEDAKLVVTQPTAGNYKAFTAVCTHQGCIVGSVKGKSIGCPCHGSAFNIADGSVLNGPADRPLREIKVAVEGDSIVKA